jgi:hypothetical protein
MLENEGYRYTFRILNAYDFSATTVVMQMCLNVMCIHTLSVLLCMSVDSYMGQWLIVMLLSCYTIPSDKERNV